MFSVDQKPRQSTVAYNRLFAGQFSTSTRSASQSRVQSQQRPVNDTFSIFYLPTLVAVIFDLAGFSMLFGNFLPSGSPLRDLKIYPQPCHKNLNFAKKSLLRFIRCVYTRTY
ncbi:MAG: hypothetical protein CMJ74_12200 [Planctomycetaceae bacterium]|nr:hypothetical protein [Planctomycetaceae bacterium]